MANDLATRNGGGYLASSEDYYAALAQEAQGLKGGGAGKAFMKFDGNTGDYSYGADDEELPLGTRLAMNPRSYQRGYVIWVDGEVVYEEMTPLGTPQPTKNSLPDHGPYGEDDGPVEQYVIDFKMIDEPHVEMIFQANNSSKRRALAALLKDFGNLFRTHPGQVPIVEIDEREFETTGGKDKDGKTSKRKYRKHAPSFKIVDWMDEADLLALTQGAEGDYEDDPPARGGRGRDREDDRGTRRGGRDEDDRGSRRSSRDEDDAPRGRRASRDEDDAPRGRGRDQEDEAPRGRGRDREEDEAPRSRRAARDEDDAPRGRGRERDEPEADEPPASRRRAARDEPEADEPPASRRRASSAAEAGDDDAPPRRSRSRDEAEPEPEPARRSSREDREEEPTTRRGRDRDEGEQPAKRGRF